LLENCLHSVYQAQTPSCGFEVIVVDDGSSDSTDEFLQEKIRNHKNLFVIRQKNQGQALARNKGVEKARGEIIAFTDDDCRVSPLWLQTIENIFKNDGVFAAQGPVIGIADNVPRYPLEHFIHSPEGNAYLTCNLAIQKSLFVALGGFDGQFRLQDEDTDLCLQVLRKGKIVIHKDMLVSHPPRKSNFIKEILGASSYGKYYVNSEYLLYIKNRADYNKVRFRKSFYSTIFHLCLKYVFYFARCPYNTALRFPVAYAGLVVLCFFRQISITFWFLHLLAFGSKTNQSFPKQEIDIKRSLNLNDMNNTGYSAKDFWVRISPLRNLFRRLFNKPGYQMRDVKMKFLAKDNMQPQEPFFLLRVDDFPEWTYSASDFLVFHNILQKAGIPYLLASTPRPSLNPTKYKNNRFREWTDEEIKVLRQVKNEGVEIALHGLHHQKTHPVELTEIAGSPESLLRLQINEGLKRFEEIDIHPEIYVPPFNTLDRSNWFVLSEYFRVVCGGPESVRFLGFPCIPLFIKNSLFLPSFYPFYTKSKEVIPFLKNNFPGIISICLHWGWEAKDNFTNLIKFAEIFSGKIRSWPELLSRIKG
jgi:glycosyltransferase involved in cell wall biosynthesis